MNVLVIGGTRFFGRRLVHRLLAEGHAVTVASRGQTVDDFGERVERIRVDRTDDEAMRQAFAGRSFDVVFDQVGFNPVHARGAIEAFGQRVQRYVFTSSISVYEGGNDVSETAFDPAHYPVDLAAGSYEYGEGKRQAEAYLMQHAPFDVVTVRVAMVVSGDDDYTGRFAFHVNHVAEGVSIAVPDDVEHPITFVTAGQVADFLHFVGVQSDFVGPVNAGNDGYESTQSLCRRIGQIVSRDASFHLAASPEADADFSPYGFSTDLTVSNRLAKEIGFAFTDWRQELPSMVGEVLKRRAE
ncbi:NAD-dependent epimerase/dehydratase family protein [Alicyclobacillus fastidiosus]|uniref:NAD-dependent epimerase/dehydratase family protein n=1 Tax=Alicyclobacillus fastidiosus TaxID=392011 RepID=A0ABV5AKZ9_9BACL|nr:NAD-dependent epimerase/dehydratase family protein [Alicyclobacillus fastidiosus]WEH10195.1 NAD-dependent epimerase/dehydratase family protein [Alicyclobacillus fastidiosus]